MFSKSITNSSQFLMMPQSSQNLYFHLGMNADDDGFCEHFSLMRMTDSKPDDLKILQAKGFVNVFDDKVLVIIDWKENNYLRADRYTASKYLEVYKEELHRLSSGIPMVDTGKDRLGEDSIGKVSEGKNIAEPTASAEIVAVIDAFKEVNPAFNSWYGNKSQRAAAKWLVATYGVEEAVRKISYLPKINKLKYAPITTTPCQLRDNLAKIESFLAQHKSKENKIIGLD